MTQGTQRIGWIGMGRMGYSMCERLLKAGHEVSIWNRTKAKAEPNRYRARTTTSLPGMLSGLVLGLLGGQRVALAVQLDSGTHPTVVPEAEVNVKLTRSTSIPGAWAEKNATTSLTFNVQVFGGIPHLDP